MNQTIIARHQSPSLEIKQAQTITLPPPCLTALLSFSEDLTEDTSSKRTCFFLVGL